jgi:hypothetical protein
MKPSRPTYVIKLQSLHGSSIHALRAVLKRLLRTHGFRCVSAKEIPAQQDSPPGDPGK